ncbi:MAG: TetR/AcrR family transcriptional regulator, partial [Sphingomonadaceae bacterium]
MAERELSLSREELYELVWSKPLFAAAAEYGLTGNALAKICDRLLVPYPTRGHWQKVHAGKFQQMPPLPPAPEPGDERVVFSKERAASRRPRQRLSEAARRAQIIGEARKIIL